MTSDKRGEKKSKAICEDCGTKLNTKNKRCRICSSLNPIYCSPLQEPKIIVLNETQLKNKELVKARKSAGLEPVQEPREDIDLKFAKGMLKANKVFYTKQQTIKVLPPQPEKPDYQSKIEKEAMNIVYQIGDLLSFNIPISIVDARQKTNDKAIDFVSDQLLSLLQEVRSEAYKDGRQSINQRLYKYQHAYNRTPNRAEASRHRFHKKQNKVFKNCNLCKK